MKIGAKVTNPGELDQEIVLAGRTNASDAGGFQSPSHPFIAKVWARWENVHGLETWTADSLGAEAAATVLIRYREDLDATCVVVKGATVAEVKDHNNNVIGHTFSGGKIYEIVGDPDDIGERHEYMELKVKRIKAG